MNETRGLKLVQGIPNLALRIWILAAVLISGYFFYNFLTSSLQFYLEAAVCRYLATLDSWLAVTSLAIGNLFSFAFFLACGWRTGRKKAEIDKSTDSSVRLCSDFTFSLASTCFYFFAFGLVFMPTLDAMESGFSPSAFQSYEKKFERGAESLSGVNRAK